MATNPELDRASAFEEGMQEAIADRVVGSSVGGALFTDRAPLIWSLNYLRVDVTDASAEDIAAEAERLQRDAGLPHRRVVVLGEEAGKRLEPQFTALGWDTEAYVFMAHRREKARPADMSAVVEVPDETLADLHAAISRERLTDATEEVLAQLRVAGRLRAPGISTKHFAVLVDGKPVSSTDLFSDGRTAQVEDVMTLSEYRGHGYAKAVVSRAVDEAWAGGHDFVFLMADARDWPKELYRRMGFETIGEKYAFRLFPLPE